MHIRAPSFFLFHMSRPTFGAFVSLDQTSVEERTSQKRALDEMLGVLLSAGYFRARIPQLTAFDKVRHRQQTLLKGIAPATPLQQRDTASRLAGAD